MKIVDDFSSYRVSLSPLEPEAGKDDTSSKPALFQPALSFRPTLQTVLSEPAPALKTLGPAATSGGAVAPAIPPGATANSLPNLDQMPEYVAGAGNNGGTTTLSEILTYLGKPVSQADIDHDIRRTNVLLAPEDMIDFARDQGLKAEGYNNGTLDELKSMIDAGHPVQAMLDNGAKWINITGYDKDPNTGEDEVIFHDPSSGTEQRMSVSDFEKHWGNNDNPLQVVPTGYKNYFIAYGGSSADLPPGRNDGIQGIQSAAGGVANFANGADRIVSPDSWGGFVHGLFQVSGSIPQALVGYFGAELQAGGQWLNREVAGIPVVRNFAEPIGDVVDGAGAVLGDLSNGVGQSVDDFGAAFEDLSHGDGKKALKKLGDAVEDAGGAVVDAGKDAVSAVGHAISDLFSW